MNTSHSSRFSNQPLVTFVLIAYNQEKYIKEAVEAALAQTYTPLEIIMSDDCSEDRTFEIIKQMAAEYQGPHTLVANRTPKNMGLAENLNAACALARGKLIVAAAGDDVSLPERTQILYDAWRLAGSDVHSIFSDATYIDEDGNQREKWFDGTWIVAKTLEEGIHGRAMAVLGCSHMFSRKTFDIFGPIPPGVLQEDNVIPFRSLLLGRVEFVPKSLVLYRRHGSNLWQKKNDLHYGDSLRRLRWRTGEIATINCRISDTQRAVELDLLSRDTALVLLKQLRSMLKEKQFQMDLAEVSPAFRIIKMFKCMRQRYMPASSAANALVASFESDSLDEWWRMLKKPFRQLFHEHSEKVPLNWASRLTMHV